MTYINGNKPQEEQTASPDKYPQGRFNEKQCRMCSELFSPRAPSQLYCCTECANKASADKYLRSKYGITLKQYSQLLLAQGHRCAICGGEGFTMADHHKMKLVVDHCHATKKVRGLLCHNCNRALGLFKDNVDALYRAANYLLN